MDKKIKRLQKAMELESSYNEINKKEFKAASTGFLKELAKSLDFIESKVSFNSGGVAVSGDACLMGMYDDTQGLYISFNSDRGCPDIMFRTIKHMKDYTGGNNNWFNLDNLATISEIVEIVTRIKR